MGWCRPRRAGRGGRAVRASTHPTAAGRSPPRRAERDQPIFRWKSGPAHVGTSPRDRLSLYQQRAAPAPDGAKRQPPPGAGAARSLGATGRFRGDLCGAAGAMAPAEWDADVLCPNAGLSGTGWPSSGSVAPLMRGRYGGDRLSAQEKGWCRPRRFCLGGRCVRARTLPLSAGAVPCVPGRRVGRDKPVFRWKSGPAHAGTFPRGPSRQTERRAAPAPDGAKRQPPGGAGAARGLWATGRCGWAGCMTAGSPAPAGCGRVAKPSCPTARPAKIRRGRPAGGRRRSGPPPAHRRRSPPGTGPPAPNSAGPAREAAPQVPPSPPRETAP